MKDVILECTQKSISSQGSNFSAIVQDPDEMSPGIIHAVWLPNKEKMVFNQSSLPVEAVWAGTPASFQVVAHLGYKRNYVTCQQGPKLSPRGSFQSYVTMFSLSSVGSCLRASVRHCSSEPAANFIQLLAQQHSIIGKLGGSYFCCMNSFTCLQEAEEAPDSNRDQLSTIFKENRSVL